MSKIGFLIYDLFFLLGFIIYLPVYIWRRKITLASLKERLGFIPRMPKGGAIWIQVVSVGEVNLIENLLKELKKTFDCPLVVSTTTLTGNITARRKYSGLAEIIFFPLDIGFILRQVLKRVSPRIFIAVETEIWPQLFSSLHKSNIPILIINGRISDPAFRKYRLIQPLVKPLLNKCRCIGVQNEFYRRRFLALGADEKRVVISGNLKFESIALDEAKAQQIKEKYQSFLKPEGELVLIAASTHSPEEEIISVIYRQILNRRPKLVLLIAPRHPERVGEVEKVVAAQGFNPLRLSEAVKSFLPPNPVFIADTVGELLYLFRLADICFMGGTLAAAGGHNILEPVYCLKPTLFGPHMENFAEIESAVLAKEAGMKVSDTAALQENLWKLIESQNLREEFSRRCAEVFKESKGILAANLKLIEDALSGV